MGTASPLQNFPRETPDADCKEMPSIANLLIANPLPTGECKYNASRSISIERSALYERCSVLPRFRLALGFLGAGWIAYPFPEAGRSCRCAEPWVGIYKLGVVCGLSLS